MVGNKIIAVDLGGTFLRTAIVKNNKILKYVKKNTPKNKKDLVKELLFSIESLMTKDVKAIGVASAGPLKNGIIKNPPNLPFKTLNLKRILKKKFKKKIEIRNDAGCVALAEAKLGCKKNNFFVLTLGTGIGGGIIIDGEIENGEGYGGELGHIHLDKEKDFEDIWQDIRKRYRKEFGGKTLIKDLLKIKNPKAKKFLKELSVCLGQGIASLIAVFDPEVVVLSGGVKETGNVFLNMVKKQVTKYNVIPEKHKIKWTTLEHPGILGAALLMDNSK
jgi:glucokinase